MFSFLGKFSSLYFSSFPFLLLCVELCACKRCCGPNPQCLWMSPYLDVGSLLVTKTSSLVRALIQYEWWKTGSLDTETDTQRGNDVNTQGENQLHKPRNTWHYQTRGERSETDIPSQLSEGTNPAVTLTSDFQPPQLWGNTFLLFKQPNLWSFVKAVPGNENIYLMHKVVVSMPGINVCK